MAFAQEGSWISSSIGANAASSNLTPTFLGGGAELLIVPMIIDTSNGCTGATLNNHSGFASPIPAPYVATAANGYIIIFAWGVYIGAAGTPTLTVSYAGGSGTSGATGGKLQNGVFTGYATNILASPGPSTNASGSASPAGVTLNGVGAGSLTVALMSNVGAHSWTAGSGYTLAFNTSPWAGNVTGLEYTTGLSEPGGNPVINASFPSSPSNWNMMAVNFPVAAALPAVPPPLAGRCVYFLP